MIKATTLRAIVQTLAWSGPGMSVARARAALRTRGRHHDGRDYRTSRSMLARVRATDGSSPDAGGGRRPARLSHAPVMATGTE